MTTVLTAVLPLHLIALKQALAGCKGFALTDCIACSSSKLQVFCAKALGKGTLCCLSKGKVSWADFTDCTGFLSPACCIAAKLDPLVTTILLDQCTVRVTALHLVQTISATLVQQHIGKRWVY